MIKFTFLISDERELKELVMNEMIKLQLHDEVERLRKLDINEENQFFL
ncbi:hypothetical protein [Ureibacillus massiliensis]|nr:hypothetical protein [Ureibacillus massiliensis]